MQLPLVVSQDCITSFTQGFFSVPRSDVISRLAEVLLQVANTFPPPFHGYPPSAAVNKSWKVWSWSEAGLPCWRAVTYFSPNLLSLTVIRNTVHRFSQNDLVQNHISRKMQFLREQDSADGSPLWKQWFGLKSGHLGKFVPDMLVFESQVAVGHLSLRLVAQLAWEWLWFCSTSCFSSLLTGDLKQVEETACIRSCICVSAQKYLLNCFLYRELKEPWGFTS